MKTKFTAIIVVSIIFLTGCASSIRSQMLKNERFYRVQFIQTTIPNDITIVSNNTHAKAGENSSLTAKGRPGVRYTITARYKLSGKELVTSQSKIADNDGLVTWVWNIKKETTAGSYPITISGGGKSITSNYTVDK